MEASKGKKMDRSMVVCINFFAQPFFFIPALYLARNGDRGAERLCSEKRNNPPDKRESF